MELKPWKTLKTVIIAQNEHIQFVVDDFETADGRMGQYYYTVQPGNAIAVIGQLSEDAFVLVREYRYLCNAVSLGHIGAGVEEGEQPEDAARREMEEEAGYRAGTIIHLGGQYSLPGGSKEYVDVYLAQELEPVPRRLDPFEQLEPVVLSSADIDEAIRTGEVIDGITITTWFRVKQFLNL